MFRHYQLFGLIARKAIGSYCYEILQGRGDADSEFSSNHCAVQQAMLSSSPQPNFDLQIQTLAGRQWCNITIVMVRDRALGSVQSIHIVRPREIRKRLEQLLHDFTKQRAVSPKKKGTKLTPREVEILRLMASGMTTQRIADNLSISSETVRNHIKHILSKLEAHNRLEAVRRAEKIGII